MCRKILLQTPIQNVTKILPVGFELFHMDGEREGLPDGWTDGIKGVNICFFAIFAKVLENVDVGKVTVHD